MQFISTSIVTSYSNLPSKWFLEALDGTYLAFQIESRMLKAMSILSASNTFAVLLLKGYNISVSSLPAINNMICISALGSHLQCFIFAKQQHIIIVYPVTSWYWRLCISLNKQFYRIYPMHVSKVKQKIFKKWLKCFTIQCDVNKKFRLVLCEQSHCVNKRS